MVFQQHQAAERRTRHHGLGPDREPAGVAGVEAVRVLRGVDGLDHRFGPDGVGQGKLHEDAVDLRGVVQAPHQPEQRRLGGAGVETVLEGGHAGFAGLLRLVAHVDQAGRVLSHQHHREPRNDAVRRLEARHLPADPRPQLRRAGLAVEKHAPFARCLRHGYDRARPPAPRKGRERARRDSLAHAFLRHRLHGARHAKRCGPGRGAPAFPASPRAEKCRISVTWCRPRCR